MTASPDSTIPEHEPQVRNERYRVRFDSRDQAAYCAQIAGANRFVWNLVLTICEWRYDRHLAEKESDPEAKPPGTSAFDLFKLFTVVRSRPQEEWYRDFLQSDRGEYYRDRDLAWLRDLPFAPVRYSLKYLADSYKRFHKAATAAKKQGRKLPRRKADGKPQGFPRRKGFGVKCDGFTIPDGVRMDGERLRIPKAGWVRLDGSGQYWGCDAKQVRIIREGTEDRPKWYAIVSYHVTPDRLKQPAWTGALGVDRNVGQATDSDGVVYESPDDSLIDTKIKRKQRELSRKKGWGPKTRGQKKSNRGRRVNGQLKKLHRKKKRRRENAAHQHSRTIANTAHTVVLEDLNTAAMTKSAKGTVEEPGRNVKQKSGLNRSVLASGWGALDRNLDYKAGASSASIRRIRRKPVPIAGTSTRRTAKHRRISTVRHVDSRRTPTTTPPSTFWLGVDFPLPTRRPAGQGQLRGEMRSVTALGRQPRANRHRRPANKICRHRQGLRLRAISQVYKSLSEGSGPFREEPLPVLEDDHVLKLLGNAGQTGTFHHIVDAPQALYCAFHRIKGEVRAKQDFVSHAVLHHRDKGLPVTPGAEVNGGNIGK